MESTEKLSGVAVKRNSIINMQIWYSTAKFKNLKCNGNDGTLIKDW